MPGHPKHPNHEQAVNDRTDRPEHRLLVVAVLLILGSAWPGTPALGQPPGETTVLRAARVLDGRGEVLEDRDLVVRDRRIAEIVARGSGRGDRVYDLSALTVLPGYIDTHVTSGTTSTTTAGCTGRRTTPASPT